MIKSVDGPNRRVTFLNEKTNELVTENYDLLHIVPPQSPHPFIAQSPLANETGFVDVDQSTLQHKKYSNVFSLGDSAGLPAAKTAAGVFSQAPVVVQNLHQQKDGKVLNAKYDGYNSCPLFTGDHKLMLMEFKYGM